MANVTYTVKKGDTLSGIAQTYRNQYYTGMTINAIVSRLADINDIANPDRIYIGQVLIISGTPAPKVSNVSQKAIVDKFGLQSNTERTLFATWKWDKSNTDHYEVEWLYDTGDGVNFIGNITTVQDKQDVYSNAPSNAKNVMFRVKPVSKKRKSGNKEISYWSASWSTRKRHYFSVNPPLTPPDPSDSNISLSDYVLKITLNNIDNLNAESIQINVIKVSTNKVFKNVTIKIANGKVSYSCTLTPGDTYIVKYRSISGSIYSDWTNESQEYATLPAATEGIYSLYALTESSAIIEWYDVTSAESYEIEYTTSIDYFESLPSAVQKTTSLVSKAIIPGLTAGIDYYFRVKSVNSKGTSPKWSAIESLKIGIRPNAPTTWSSTATAKTGSPLYLYWIHNAADQSRQTEAVLEIESYSTNSASPTQVDTHRFYLANSNSVPSDTTKIVELSNFTGADLVEGAVIKVFMTYLNTNSVGIKLNVNGLGEINVQASNPNMFYWSSNSIVSFTYDGESWNIGTTTYSQNSEMYSVDTSRYPEGTKLIWKVKTAGILEDPEEGKIYSEWSTPREIAVYSEPTAAIDITDIEGIGINQIESFPFDITITSGQGNQKPIGCFINITSNQSYETVDELGNDIKISSGDTIFSEYYEMSSNQLKVNFSANSINLDNDMSYKISCIISFDSGLTAEASEDISVLWADDEYWPDAEIGYDSNTYTTVIKPYCKNNNNELISGITLSVYRREFDGRFTEIASGLDNLSETSVTDPHPSLDFARYRIVAKTDSTGAVSYYDAPGYPIGETSIIIQWDEEWIPYDSSGSDAPADPNWSGSIVKLPYNIDISDKTSSEVELVKYVGREYPVSYYGTQKDHSATWNALIRSDDHETIYGLRRLSLWAGDVYVREPSGSGYWANISVSINKRHLDLTIPVSLNITRVEGGE